MVRPVEVEEVCVGVCVCVCVVCEGGEGTHGLIVRPVEVEEVCVGRSSCMTRGGEGAGNYRETAFRQTP